MTDNIIDQQDKIAFKNECGRAVAWGFINDGYGNHSEDDRAAFEASYEYVMNGIDNWFHTDGDLYQGSTLMRVIRRKADGELFGFAYWQGGGKHGEADMEHNGDDHGFPSKYDWQDGVDEDEFWYVFQPVKATTIPAYNFEQESK